MSAPALIHGLLDRAARLGGSGVAVVDHDRTLSYSQLESESNRLGHALIAHGVKPGDRVGLLLEKSLESVIGIYAVLKVGATYVPLDEQAPVRRLAYMVKDAGIRCLVSADRMQPVWEALVEHGAPLQSVFTAGARTLAPDGMTRVPGTAVAGYPDHAPEVAPDPDALAYILYTSGSTGEPKGVMLSHRNGLEFVDWAAREVGIGPADRLSSHAPFHFDLSVFDLFAAAWGGATLVLVPRSASVFPVELANFIRAARISVWYSVPSVLTLLATRGELDRAPLTQLRAVIFAGEVFPTKYLRTLIELVPGARYYNFYGPTETNVCTWYEVPSASALEEDLPIGRPIPGVAAIVEREDGEIAAPGEVGELLIRGPTVMHGYWGDAQRTDRVLRSEAGERTYRTGDLVREGPEGQLQFLGRRDSQVKTRGYRVELGEIEAALNALEHVVESAVVAIPDDTVTNRLAAFVVTREAIAAAELAGLCADRLPRHMIPDTFEFLPVLPRSSTGKIDRRALPSR